MERKKLKQKLFLIILIILIMLVLIQVYKNIDFLRNRNNLGKASFEKAYHNELQQLRKKGVIVKEINKNKDYGLYVVHLKETLRLGEEKSGHIFSLVGGVAIDKDENIYVLETKEGRVLKFNKHGKYLFSFGRKGKGPKELLFATSMILGKNNNLYILCSGTRRIAEFTLKGEFIRTIPVFELRGLPFSFTEDRSGNFYICFYSEKLNTVVHKYNTDGKLVKSFVSPVPFLKPLSNMERGLIPNMSNGYILIDDNDIIFSRSNPYEINFYSTDGVLKRRLYRKSELMPFPKVEKHGKTITFHMPVYSEFIGMIDDNLLHCTCVPPGNIPEDIGAVFEIIDPNGQLLATKKIKEQFYVIALDRDNIYVFDHSSFLLYRYKISIEKMR